jgi:hypothetical protein
MNLDKNSRIYTLIVVYQIGVANVDFSILGIFCGNFNIYQYDCG